MTIQGERAYAVVTKDGAETVLIGVARKGKRSLDCLAFSPEEAGAIALAIQRAAIRPEADV